MTVNDRHDHQFGMSVGNAEASSSLWLASVNHQCDVAVMLAVGAANAYRQHRLQCARADGAAVLQCGCDCAEGACLAAARMAAAGSCSAPAGSWQGGVMLCPVLACSWKHCCTVQMPAAHAEPHSQQDGARGSAARKPPTCQPGQPVPTTQLAACQSADWCQGTCIQAGCREHKAGVKHSDNRRMGAYPPMIGMISSLECRSAMPKHQAPCGLRA